MKTIFVDMDGVLTNFEARYVSEFGKSPSQVRADKVPGEYGRLWNKFVDDQNFKSLPFFPGAEELIAHLNGLKGVQVCILTSSGGFDRHAEVQDHKLFWLRSRGIKWPAVVVPGRRFKSGFAHAQSFMIDDTPDVIESFIQHGGAGVIHVRDAKWRTYHTLEEWLK